MSLEDFSKNFEKLIVSKVKKYREFREKTLMEKTESSGKSSHAWEIEVNKSLRLIIGIHQEDENCVGAKELRKYIDLGVVIFKKSRFGYEKFIKIQENKSQREIFYEETLEKGNYLIFPISSCSALLKPIDFTPLSFQLFNELGDLHPVFLNILKDLYRRTSLNINTPLVFEEFAKFNQKLGFCMTHDIFVQNILSKYSSTHEGLTLQGFFEIFSETVKERGEATVRDWLSLLGYDRDFYSIESKPLILTFQSEDDFSISRQELSSEIYSFI